MKAIVSRFKNHSFAMLAAVCAVALLVTTFGTVPAMAAEVPIANTEETVAVVTLEEAESIEVASSDLFVDRTGYIPAGQSITGSFKCPHLLGTDFVVMLCAGDGNGYLEISLLAERNQVSCGNCAIVFDYNNFRYGTYSYTITNHSSSECYYSITIYEK